MNRNLMLSFIMIFFAGFMAQAQTGVPIQLRLKSPTGTYPTETGLTFKVLVLSTTTNCILREEIFSAQSITNGNISLTLGTGSLGASDPGLTLNQVYDNTTTKTGLSCVDINNNVVSTGQSYGPAPSAFRNIRISTTIGADSINAQFNQRSTPYAIQAETATNMTGVFTGDISGTQAATSVDKIKGVAISGTAPTTGDVLQFDGTIYTPVAIPSAPVFSVAGRTGAVVLSNTDISGLGGAAILNVGTAAGTVAAGNDSRITNAVQLISASAPLASSGGTTPTLSIATANTTTTGALTAADWNIFNNKQGSLGFTPLNAASNLSDVASASTSRTNLGLGTAAVLDAGVAAANVVQLDGSAKIPLSTLSVASGTTVGVLTSTDWTSFNSKISSQWSAATGGINYASGRVGVGISAPGYAVDVSGDVNVSGSFKVNGVALGGGTVLSVGATSPVQSTGGSNPIISMARATASVDGFLASTDFTIFNNKQAALGFTPLNPSNNLSDISAASTARSNLGLGTAAVLDTGVSAANIVQLDGSAKIPVSTLPIATGSVAGALSAADWTTFNDKQAALGFTPLNAASDLSDLTSASTARGNLGLGSAAVLNAGVSSSDLVQLDSGARIPASTLPTSALTTSSTFSGDVSGTSTNIDVNKIRGIAVSAAAPTTGQALVYNGTQWIPTTGFPIFAKSTADQTFSLITLANATSLSFAVVSGTVYKYRFHVLYTSAAANTGLRLGLTFPAATSVAAAVNIPLGGDGTAAMYSGFITTSGDSVVATGTPAVTTVHYATVEGMIVPSANGTVQLQAATEVVASNIIIRAGSYAEVTVVP